MSKPEISAVVFDMDGVIVDSELQWKLAEKEFLLHRVPHWRPEDYRRVTGLSPAALYDFLNDAYGLAESRESFLNDCGRLAETIYKSRVSLAEGFTDILDRIKKSRRPLGIASSSPRNWIEMVLERFNLASWFDAVVSADDVGGRTKPLPDSYLAACARLGAKPESCAAVEDSRVGVLAAKSAGLFCLALRNGANGDQDFSAADAEITSVRNVLEILRIS
ncbi:MAG TPA: HAD-IA family hydrolase [Elusimicrobiota bacterium]|nr:HAD-IA family hydrolase [Elusimicrobiota bacterium]